VAHTLALTRTGDEAGPVQDLVAELWFLHFNSRRSYPSHTCRSSPTWT